MNLRSILAIVIAPFLLWFAGPVRAASLTFQFSGVFDTCEFDCPGSRVAPLLGTAFSGEIVIPDAGVDAAPADWEVRGYQFSAPDAHLSFTSELPAFNLDRSAPVTVQVHDCEGDACAPNEDWVFIFVRADGLMYDLVLGGTGRPMLFSDAIPSVMTIRAMWHGFEIWDEAAYTAQNKFASIRVDPYTYPSKLAMSVSVPLPAAAWLLASGVLLFGRRAQRASNAPSS
ncbi:MAG: hypothetical protein HY943_05225 [Gammaproteobacteria bacterium]|nr:hypothetical protein [Gammaproteobacteria bacterium]